MAFHISDKDGQPRQCKAATPEACPVGGEHFTDQGKAQEAADSKLASEYTPTSTLSKKVDFTNRTAMERLPDGKYSIPAGEYYVLNSEAMEFKDFKGDADAAYGAITDPSNGNDKRNMAMVGGVVDGEPVYTSTEHWSGVSNSLITPKLYESLIKKGMKYENAGDERPPVLVLEEPTTIGSVGNNGDENSDDYDYGYLELGDQRVDLFNAENSIMLSERTVIGKDPVPTKPAKKINFNKVAPMDRRQDGRYNAEPGEYYVLNTESIEFADPNEGDRISATLSNPSARSDTRVNTFVGGRIDGEPTYSVQEGRSGVSNILVTPKLYESLVKKGMTYNDGEKPPVLEFKNYAPLGSVGGNPDSADYGMMEVGDKKIDLFNGDDSVVLSERTVID